MSYARAACGLFLLALCLALADPLGALRCLGVALCCGIEAHARLPR